MMFPDSCSISSVGFLSFSGAWAELDGAEVGWAASPVASSGSITLPRENAKQIKIAKNEFTKSDASKTMIKRKGYSANTGFNT